MIAILLVAVLVTMVREARADGGDNPLKREVPLVFNKSYDIFIGNGGVYIDNSRHIGTLVVKSIRPTHRPLMWHVFTQNLIDVRIFDKDDKPFTTVYGLIRVYFNLDKFQYQQWSDPVSNMSIWYFDETLGGWLKCSTHWEAVAGAAQGRLWCPIHRFALYGLAYTKPTIIMKLIKAGIITVTPTP
jgi:hypothetical protein